MRVILSILAGLVLLVCVVSGNHMPYNRMANNRMANNRMPNNRVSYDRIPYDRIDALMEAAESDEELLRYLLQEESQITANGCSFKSSSFGGNGGNPFDELPANCTGVVKKIVIRAALYVDAIQITYELPDGSEVVGGYYGGKGGTEYVIDVDVANGERIIGIFGRSYDFVDQLGFVTNKGRIFGPYGGCGGTQFNINSCNIGGVYGRSYDWMDSIGFYCNAP